MHICPFSPGRMELSLGFWPHGPTPHGVLFLPLLVKPVHLFFFPYGTCSVASHLVHVSCSIAEFLVLPCSWEGPVACLSTNTVVISVFVSCLLLPQIRPVICRSFINHKHIQITSCPLAPRLHLLTSPKLRETLQ